MYLNVVGLWLRECDSGWGHFMLTCDWVLEGLVLLKSEYLFFGGVQIQERKWVYSSLTCRGQQNIRKKKNLISTHRMCSLLHFLLEWKFSNNFLLCSFLLASCIHTQTHIIKITHMQTHIYILYPTCLDSRQCMMNTSAPCRLLRRVKMYATTKESFWNRKAPNTHIRPSMHICAIAVTVKALQRKKEDWGGGEGATDRKWKERLTWTQTHGWLSYCCSIWKPPCRAWRKRGV